MQSRKSLVFIVSNITWNKKRHSNFLKTETFLTYEYSYHSFRYFLHENMRSIIEKFLTKPKISWFRNLNLKRIGARLQIEDHLARLKLTIFFLEFQIDSKLYDSRSMPTKILKVVKLLFLRAINRSSWKRAGEAYAEEWVSNGMGQ